MGGLARKATILDQLRVSNDNLLIIDAGDLFFKKNDIEPGITLDVAKINAEIIVESFNEIGCDAFSPGKKDFAGGIDFLLGLYKQSNFPFISSNIVNAKDELIFQPYIIKDIQGKKVALIGLTSKFDNNFENFNIIDPIKTLKNVMNEVDDISDLIILMFNASDDDLGLLYSENLPVDFILRSRGRVRSSDGGSKIPTYSAGDRGKMLYKFDFNILDSSMPFTDLQWCENTIKRVNSRLDKMKKGDPMADLDLLYKDDKSTLNRIKNYKHQLEKSKQMLEQAINKIEFSKIELGKTVYDRPDILKIVDSGKLKIKELIGPELPPEADHKGRLPGDPHYNHSH